MKVIRQIMSAYFSLFFCYTNLNDPKQIDKGWFGKPHTKSWNSLLTFVKIVLRDRIKLLPNHWMFKYRFASWSRTDRPSAPLWKSLIIGFKYRQTALLIFALQFQNIISNSLRIHYLLSCSKYSGGADVLTLLPFASPNMVSQIRPCMFLTENQWIISLKNSNETVMFTITWAKVLTLLHPPRSYPWVRGSYSEVVPNLGPFLMWMAPYNSEISAVVVAERQEDYKGL